LTLRRLSTWRKLVKLVSTKIETSILCLTPTSKIASCLTDVTSCDIVNRMVEYCRGLDAVFGAVADPTRRAILATLARGPATVTEIAKPYPVSLNAISKHLIVLERAGLIRRRVVGREHHCSIEPKRLRDAAAWFDHYRMFWEERLDSLERHLARRKKPHS
jgi:DNA-binding transcriptional ArsR family regulator